MVHAEFETEAADVHTTLGRWILADGLPFVYDPERSRGAHIVDKKTGETYLDVFSFFASMPLGHNHPKMSDAGFQQRLLQAALVKPSNSDIYTEAMADFVATFGRTMPPNFEHLFFVEGGALAVENAIKVAFDWKVRKNIARGLAHGDDPQFGTKVLHFENAFHGRSGYTLSLTNGFNLNKTKYFPKFNWPRVSTPGAVFPLEGEALDATQQAERASLAEIHAALDAEPHAIAAILLETIQGEGGDVHFRPEFLAELRRICDEREVLLIFDEIQTGMGLTGKWWAFEHFGVQPDIFSFGKKSQVCGIAANRRVDDVDSCFKISSRINSTWGGNLVDMVRCTRYIEIIEEDGLLANAAEVGAHLKGRLEALATSSSLVSNVRGRGLMIAFDLPTTALRDQAIKELRQEHALILACGPRSIRLRPVLDFTRQNADAALAKLEVVLARLA